MRFLKTLVVILLIVVLLFGCRSVKKYNIAIEKQHSVDELQEDIDYTYSKLQKLHPNLYQYTSKDSMDYFFNEFRTSVKKPMNSLEFYNRFTTVITKIGQGHTFLYPAHKKQTKKEKKKQVKRKDPFKLIKFKTLDNNIYVDKYYSKESTFIEGSQLLKIGDKNVNSLVELFKKSRTSDGYNTTFMKEYPYKNIGRFYHNSYKRKDSIQLTLQLNDSVYKAYLYSYAKKIKKDTLSKKINKTEKKNKKKEKKARNKWEYTHGYDKITKEQTHLLEFIKTKNNKSSIAYMKITSFSKGDYKTFFEESFSKIDSLKTTDLILDFRDNLGGRLSEIEDLYSYITKEDDYQFINPAKMTKANSFSYPVLHTKSILYNALIPITFPISKVIQLLRVKKIDGEPHFIFKSAKKQKAKENHRFSGKVYVLINGTSFSASSVISNKLQATKRAYIVGVETGGAYNSTVAGIFAILEMPNSKNRLRAGLMVLDTPHKQEPDGYGVKPDKHIEVTTFETDEQLDWILQQINTLK